MINNKSFPEWLEFINRNSIDHNSNKREIYIYEYFNYKSDNDAKNFKELLISLKKNNYNFLQHPLMVCGGVSFLIKNYFDKKFALSSIKRHVKEITSSSILTVSSSLSCFAKIVPVVHSDNSMTADYPCMCNNSLQDSFDVNELIGLIRLDELRGDKPILYEDWQYIYDGFNY
jgi:hypothetical protein